ncbi:hypothetical protein U0023_27555 (plasmid) [Microvirga lotononidis]|uniref:Insulinase family protein n=1 Tax=Microvirga lotononidis TaxID=864069 RepID=I4Z4A0_9HYPH|nr:hypothetical protein [Microvirga lotononidis]EIM31042.1 hypothetical protein MicloDRAFT_00000290 [Microvirga lotononidis]WQO30997.1 hypothetical protein U0023_27555 [Microvirga lotononidis]
MKAKFIAGLVVLQFGAAPAIGAAPPQEPSAPVASAREIVAGVKIPYQSFTLANGLRVLVHTDRKAPVVAVSVWYNILVPSTSPRASPASRTCSSI